METTLRHPTSILQEAAAWVLAFLFTYTAISKLYDWQATKLALYNQVLPDWSKDMLLVGIPLIELGAAALLLVPQSRRVGFLLSGILMGIFTGYVAWVWLGLAGRVPCSCGGVISSLTWGEHLIFNVMFLGISIVGWRMESLKFKTKS
jgi:hypothetical protein